MRIRWLYAGLILSLAFNLGFIAALVYQKVLKKDILAGCTGPRIIHVRTDTTSAGEQLIWMEINPDQEKRIQKSRLHFEPKVHEIKLKLHEEKMRLGELLVEDPVDTILIEKKIEMIGSLQAEIEKEVVYQLLKEKAELDPEQSHRYLKVVTEKLQGDRPQTPGARKILIKKRFTDESGNLNECIEIEQETLEE